MNAIRTLREAREKQPTQKQVLDWAVDAFGAIAKNRDERAARLIEEAVEIAQAQDVSLEVVQRIVERAFSRPPGDLGQEIGGCAITLMALAENVGLSFDGEILREWERVKSKDKAWWTRKHAEKVEAGTANLSRDFWKERAEGLEDAMRRIKALPTYSVSQSLCIDPYAEKLLKADAVYKIVEPCLRPLRGNNNA
jgi:NTP pyrophosphatase (non-canonical NTP hydrolase)